MGETLSHTPHSEHQPLSRLSNGPEEVSHTNGAPSVNGEEEPYTIKCICGFNDDTYDGNTVFCDRCNTWQHISCYYYPQTTLADEFFHACVDCKPRSIIASSATQRQKRLREPLDANEDRKAKRPNQKSHKKQKTKDLDPPGPQANGWILHKLASAEQPNSNHRDQGPPTKRPKTDHKHTGSMNSRPSNNRNRSNTGLASHGRPPLSACPPDYFSPEFINVHHQNTSYETPDTNLHLNIGVTNLLSSLLDDEEHFAKVTGQTHNEVFMKFDEPIDQLGNPVRRHFKTDKTVRFHDRHPIWPYLTTDKDLVAGDFIGELRGFIGQREEYKQDPENRWNELRHPDHFVFFHPVLPIFIDSRVEGTELRWARRSCRPNMEMKTIITGAREYRFCFTAVTKIPKDSELTIAWDLADDPQLQQSLLRGSESMNNVDRDYVCGWVGTILAHFGGCACESQTNNICLLGHFDPRLGSTSNEHPSRTSRNNKKKKASKTTPSDTGHATNSRASSEVPGEANNEVDVDMQDAQSPSRGSGKTSRDDTPTSSRHEPSVGPGDELSERDKRKLLQQERLFEQMENDNQSGFRKKKRNSGSNANTPTAVTSKTVGRSHASSHPPNSRPRRDKGTSTSGDENMVNSEEQSPKDPRVSPPSRDSISGRHASISTYVDASTQTIENKPNPPILARRFPIPPTPFMSLSKRLLQRSMRWKQVQGNPVPTSPSSPQQPASPKSKSAEEQAVNDNEQSHIAMNKEVSITDVEMKDAELPKSPNIDASAPALTIETSLEKMQQPQSPLKVTHPQIKPPPPPWPNQLSQHIPAEKSPRKDVRDAGMHVDLPSPGFFKSPPAQSPSPVPGSAPVANMVQSPLGSASTPGINTPSLQSPPLPRDNSMTKPSPAKKKTMTLSDYITKRKTTETPAVEKSPAQLQPEGLTQSPGASEELSSSVENSSVKKTEDSGIGPGKD